MLYNCCGKRVFVAYADAELFGKLAALVNEIDFVGEGDLELEGSGSFTLFVSA